MSSRDISYSLSEIVEAVVEDCVNVMVPSVVDPNTGTSLSEEVLVVGGRNGQAVRPLCLEFGGLEMDGRKNEVLYTTAFEASKGGSAHGITLLRTLVNELYARLTVAFPEWGIALPPQDPQESKRDVAKRIKGLEPISTGEVFRPRVPFMRLPPDFEQSLPPPKCALPPGIDESRAHDFRDPEEGGNGISPILYYFWWEDKFTPITDATQNFGVRMRSIDVFTSEENQAVNHAVETSDLSEETFVTSDASVKLPTGNQLCMSLEATDAAYDKERITDEMNKLGNPKKYYKEFETKQEELDRINETWLNGYETPPEEETPVREPGDPIVKYIMPDGQYATEDDLYEQPKTMEDLLLPGESIADFVARTDPLGPKKGLKRISIADNEDYQQLIADDDDSGGAIMSEFEQRERLRLKDVPYPSDPHFIGCWKFLQTPLAIQPTMGGFTKDDAGRIEQQLLDEDEQCDNMILRVDGGVFGGPILNAENGQKAVGGNWKVYQAEWGGGGGKMKGSMSTRMRIKLLVPPKKNEEVWFEGEVIRTMMPTNDQSSSPASTENDENDDGTASSTPAAPFSSLRDDMLTNLSTYGVKVRKSPISELDKLLRARDAQEKAEQLQLAEEQEKEERDTNALWKVDAEPENDFDFLQDGNDEDGSSNELTQAMLYCVGEVWVQQIENPEKRKKLGSFSAMKMMIDPADMQISVPKIEIRRKEKKERSSIDDEDFDIFN